MGEASANLSGSGTQQVWGHVHRVYQDQGGNFTQFYGEIRYYGNGYGTYTGSNIYWQMSAPGLFVNGNFTIPYANRNDTYTVLWAGYWNIGHDGNGYLAAFNADCHINGNVHSSIGNGSCYPYEEAAPRIPKPASTPGTPTFSEITPTSVRVSWGGSSDNGGSGIDGYLLRRNTVSPPESAGYVDSLENNTSRVITGLQPGQRYYFGVYAHNGSAGQWSARSGEAYVDMPSGIYVSDGVNWLPQDLRISDGSVWTSYRPKISNGTAWTDPIPQ